MTSDIVSTRTRLMPRVALRFPHFEMHYELASRTGGAPKAYSFVEIDCRDWYSELTEQLLEAMACKRFLPVYRMGDGEFIFARSGRSGRELSRRVSIRAIAKTMRALLTGRRLGHRSGAHEYGFEEYDDLERGKAYDIFLASLRDVASRGILALAFHDTPTYGPHVLPMIRWFESNQVSITRQNYHHVYSVYVLMHGPDRLRLLRGRRVLVITSLTDEKRKGIEAGLMKTGVAEVEFLSISAHKALFEIVNLDALKGPFDIALIGAGIGSVNILAQLEPLSIPCIDVGFVLSTLGNPDLRWNRPFCVADEEFDEAKLRFI